MLQTIKPGCARILRAGVRRRPAAMEMAVCELLHAGCVRTQVVSFQQILRCALLALTAGLFLGHQTTGNQSKPMPDGPGKSETQKLCAQCHELDKSFSLNQDRVGWQRTIEKMIASGMKGTEQEISAVLEYLVKNYPADDVPRINVNNAAAIELESRLSLRRSQAAAVIRYRDKHGKFKTIEDLKKVPGIDASKIEAKKDRLIFE